MNLLIGLIIVLSTLSFNLSAQEELTIQPQIFNANLIEKIDPDFKSAVITEDKVKHDYKDYINSLPSLSINIDTTNDKARPETFWWVLNGNIWYNSNKEEIQASTKKPNKIYDLYIQDLTVAYWYLWVIENKSDEISDEINKEFTSSEFGSPANTDGEEFENREFEITEFLLNTYTKKIEELIKEKQLNKLTEIIDKNKKLIETNSIKSSLDRLEIASSYWRKIFNL